MSLVFRFPWRTGLEVWVTEEPKERRYHAGGCEAAAMLKPWETQKTVRNQREAPNPPQNQQHVGRVT